jgi:hypothetical protein
VNVVDKRPVTVVTAQANAALTKVLPGLRAEIEELAGSQKGSAVFDRGG